MCWNGWNTLFCLIGFPLSRYAFLFFSVCLRSQRGIPVGNRGCWIVIEYVEGREHRVPSVNVFGGHDYSVVSNDTALINSLAGSNPKY